MYGLLLVGSNGLNFNVDAKGQSLDGNKGAGRSVSAEELLVDFVDLAKVVDVGNENIDLDDALPSGASGSNHRLDVGQDLAGLDLNVFVALNELALGGKRNLTRKVEEAIGLDGLGVRADGSRCVFSEDLQDGISFDLFEWTKQFKLHGIGLLTTDIVEVVWRYEREEKSN